MSEVIKICKTHGQLTKNECLSWVRTRNNKATTYYRCKRCNCARNRSLYARKVIAARKPRPTELPPTLLETLNKDFKPTFAASYKTWG